MPASLEINIMASSITGHLWTTGLREGFESVMLFNVLNCIEYRFAAAPKFNS